jgi:hypothetical protein
MNMGGLLCPSLSNILTKMHLKLSFRIVGRFLFVVALCAGALSAWGSPDTQLYLAAGVTNGLFGTVTTNTLQLAAQPNPVQQGVTSIISPATLSVDFYSPPLISNKTLAAGDGIGGANHLGFINNGANDYTVTTIVVTAYDYSPALGISIPLVAQTITGNNSVKAGKNAQVPINPGGTTLLLPYTFFAGDMVRINFTVVATGTAPVDLALYYSGNGQGGGNGGNAVSTISFPHGENSITWPFGALAQPNYFESVTNVGSTNTVTITNYTGPASSLSVPSLINGLSVTAIGSNSFAGCVNLTNAFFLGNAPGGDPSVFAQDTNLTIYYAAGGTGWGTNYFGVPCLVWPQFFFTTNANQTLTLVGASGMGGTIVIPTNYNGYTVTAISNNAFSSNTTVTNVIIGSTITSIGLDAFAYCTNLYTVEFSGHEPSIDPTAFQGDPYAMAYFLPGTGTWTSSVGGISTESEALTITLATPTNYQAFVPPANIVLTANVTTALSNNTVNFYNESGWIGTDTSAPYTMTLSNVPAGGHYYYAVVTNPLGVSATSASSYVTVNNSGSTLIDFDSLNTTGSHYVDGATLSSYLAQYGVSVISVTPNGNGHGLGDNDGEEDLQVVNQTNLAGGGYVSASSAPNVLTEMGSVGPASFALEFSPLLSQFTFTRPALVANPGVTMPAWQVEAYDSLGLLLDQIQVPALSSFTNLPAQTYTLSGGSIAAVEFDSEGEGLTTFNTVVLDDFLLTPGVASNLPPSILISQPTAGQVLKSEPIPLSVQTCAGSGSVSSVTYYVNGIVLTNGPGSFNTTWMAPSNGSYVLTAVVTNSFGLSSTSAPVPVTVALGFAFTSQPQSQTIPVGGNATLSVTTTGTNTVYQWYFNGGAIPNATNATYTVQNAATTMTGFYAVTALSGRRLIVSEVCFLDVLTPPAVGAISASTNHGIITLSVQVSDSVPFYAQWQLNGNNIAGASNSYFAGTSRVTYSVSASQALNSGTYQAVLANAVASTTTSPFTLTIGSGALGYSTNYNLANCRPLRGITNGFSVWGRNNASALPPQDGPAQIAGKPAAGFLWYSWTADFNGIISLTTRGSTFDTLVGVYTLDVNSNLTLVTSDDDSGGFFTSLVTFNCQQGTTYYICIAGYKGATGLATLELSPGYASGFLGPTGGYSVGGSAPVITQQPLNQIVQPGDTAKMSVQATGSVSYLWFYDSVPVANCTASALVLTNFLPAAVGNYSVWVSNQFGVVQSATASIQIATQSHNQTPTNVLVDKFGDAVDLTGAQTTARYRPQSSGGDTGGFVLSQSFDTTGATKEFGEPNHAGQPGGASYWYSYTAGSASLIQFDTVGSSFNTILAVYTGDGSSFATLNSVGSAYTTNFVQNGQPIVLVSNVATGTTFYIAIDGYLGASGAAVLNVTLNPSTNSLLNTNLPPLTNNNLAVAITSPRNNYLTTNPIVPLSGIMRSGTGRALGETSLALSLNGTPVTPTLGAPGAVVRWSVPSLALAPGANLVTAQAIGMESDGTENDSFPVSRTIFLVPAWPTHLVKTVLTLQTSGQGKILGLPSDDSLEVNQVYEASAVAAPGWVFNGWSSATGTNALAPLSAEPRLSFVMSSNLVLQANFTTNPFPSVAGRYSGLFYPSSGVTEDSSGFLAADIDESPRGTFSARLYLDGATYGLSGAFDLNGNAGKALNRPGKTPLIVELHLDLTSPGNPLTGYIFDWSATGWTSQLQADRAVFNARLNPATGYAGRYTVIVPPATNSPTNLPGGFGYATVTEKMDGTTVIAGRLADGAPFSQSVPLSATGYIPLYASLYARQGALLDWVVLTNLAAGSSANAVLGNGVTWIKQSSRSGLYSGGFTNTNLVFYGSLYSGPNSAAGEMTNITLTFCSDELSSPLVFSNLALSRNHLVIGGSERLNPEISGALDPTTGFITLTARPGNNLPPIVAKGVLLQDGSSTNAAGWFPGVHQSGSFLLQQ